MTKWYACWLLASRVLQGSKQVRSLDTWTADTRSLIFEDIKLFGFWLMHWENQHSPEEVKALDDKVYSLIGDVTFKFPVAATYPLSEYKNALKHASEPRFGTVLLTVD